MPDSADLPARPVIRLLPRETVNRIAAGEVVERPASAMKELVENALDAGARRIAVTIEGGGLTRLLVEDDGCGMSGPDMALALERHATSKLTPDAEGRVDLLNIASMGFRGEALPAIASVSRLTLTSRPPGEPEALSLHVSAGERDGPRPAAWTARSPHGTQVEVRDLFYATPARLKFMKSERAEALAIADALRRLAMARPDVAFALSQEGRTVFRFDAIAHGALGNADPHTARLTRLGAIMGAEFRDNALPIDAERDGVRLAGFAGLPTLNRGSAQHQYLFVNARPVKDRMLTGVVRAAYQDFLAGDRHPMLALFVDLDPELVDVNVHPAKTEVRFRDPANVRGLMIGALRHALAAAGHRASTTVAGAALGRMTPGGLPYAFGSPSGSGTGTGGQGGGWEVAARERFSAPGVQEAAWAQFVLEGGGVRPVEDLYKTGLPPSPPPPTPVEPWSYPGANGASNGLNPTGAGGSVPPSIPPLGYARAQFHETYIVSQTADGLVIVDQHAAHERLVYEAMKAEMARSGVRRQALLIPEIVELGEEGAIRIGERAEELGALGLEIEPFGPGAVLVRATPALFGVMDVKGLVRDLADELMEYDAALALNARFEHIMGNMACRSSVRAGRRLSIDEMNALLRAMEATPHSGQCNHGRPTYVELKRADIERLFGRK